MVMSTPLRVLLAEDHAVVREGTRRILETDPGLEVVGEASDGLEAVALATRLCPDVVLLDLGLPGLNGIEATRRLRASGDGPKVLILSAYDDKDLVVGALEAGASGYLLKTAHDTEVLAAIRAVARGDIVLHPPIARHFLRPRHDAARMTPSSREIHLLDLAARGQRTKEIAAELDVSSRAVEAAFTRIFNKLGVSSRTEAIAVAMSRGLIGSQHHLGDDR